MPFTPVQTFLGGLLLHVSTSTLLSDTGRVFGISSVIDGAILGDHAKWRWALLAGLLSGPALVSATGLSPALPDPTTWVWATQPLTRLALAGALVGFGSKLGSGCTSGHMLCGISRFSPRSIIATATFFTTSVLVAKLVPSQISESTLPAYKAVYPANNYLPALAALVVAAIVAKNVVRRFVPAVCKDTDGNCDAIVSPTDGFKLLPYLVSGLTFSLGLIASGMVSPLKVLGFLRMPPPLETWDPSLGMIILGGVIPNAIHYYFLRTASEKPTPLFDWENWQVPTRRDIDWKLIVGATAFGAGWGLGGVCPGPAIVTLGQLATTWFNGTGGEQLQAAAVGWGAYAANFLVGMAGARALMG